MKLTPDIIRLLPKCDLHLHMDGSLRVGTLIDMARAQGVTLPSYTAEGLYELVFKEQYADLTDYLTGFQYTVAVLQQTDTLEQVAYELMEDNILEGSRYIEVRFAPQLHVHDGLGYDEIMAAVDRGLCRARDHYNNASQAIRDGLEPPYAYGIIACAMRKFEPFYSEFYRRLFDVHRFAPRKDIYGMASLELARAMVDVRDRLAIPIVGLDLAGDESGYPPIDHKEAFQYAHRRFMKKTVHAGEAFGPQSIFQAISELHADRVGHGYHLFDADMLHFEKKEQNVRYVEELSQFIGDRRITIEVCLSSNLQTDPKIVDLSHHPLREMKRRRLSITLGTDNRLVSRTDTCRELTLALRHFDFTRAQLRNLLIYGFKRSFFPGDYEDKRHYVRQIIDYYELIERTHFPTDGFEAITA